jgi:excisionase family DNA binding protein
LWKQLVKVAEVQEDPKTKADNRLLSLKELAEYLSCSRTYAANLIADGTLPSLKLSSLRRVRKADVDAYVEKQLSKNGG